ncbi:threonine--tRNA ligase [Pseudosulfitobacter pseudonitzschiae]|uniref:threonine--tRNA ligase n=1 Tax=Pseudosulfitobacter pseudonitzschiae TaxID=1402135 RepID=UPI001AF71312|nr:threonine--tRNA ligase [Pseudosulfitobacter pseudonitzschiae]MBM1813788.1 threonine--tRNA ligase [Pseudosulfitobacter pseudonitzschiae]MBM1830781.1 threonine--tRNA ligase [Pseudosulfitobacter pseudonitzschiae]MBM1835648.1 threonine--tRNA ligase [Pseudosulfitobacter pseudonitzschiae]MBM1840494.1 threonine--tRNA ligase [Pseudosulfitobacter pseudonitzschiae]MBM1845518.1 threonine--tRNA ligase [Pseudosulfitobacter pseudonitzschiae]
MAQVSLTFPDGNARDYDAGITAAEVAESISKSLAKKAISATVDGQHWDLQWPINADAQIAIHTMQDEEQANELVRHDLAHIMARAVQEIWPDTKVTIGPVIKDGWYYDFDRAEPFTPEDLGEIEKKMKEIINKRDPVRTEVWERDVAIKYYEDRGEPYKVELIESIPGDEPLRMYWHGDWQDLCRGPHLQHTGQVPGDAFKLMSIAGAYWRGDSSRQMLQRIYGVAFTGKEKLRAHLNMLEEAAKRDHRKLGREMDLFHMQEEAPGQVFWHPNGWTIYTELQDYMRRKQRAGGYREINTPQVVDRKLWEASGHWDKYQHHMFIVEVDESRDGENDDAEVKNKAQTRINALKPMNCPCHVQVFNQGLKSYRDLPLRLAEFGSCARFEPSGALHGIMRVRGFTQDDAHIFCTEDQIEAECARFIEFLADIYAELGFPTFEIKFATRPEKRVGTEESWDYVENALEQAIRKTGRTYTLEPGDGAFYGPKLDFYLTDAIGRVWQCGTFQVDPNLPERLDATYIAQDGAKVRPFMLHRATLGSFERFIGILIEEHAGKLPFWLAPRQVVVASIISDADDYVQEVVAALQARGVRAEADLRNEKINYKVREHSVGKVPVILAVGAREVEERTLSVRRLGEKQTSVQSLDDVLVTLADEATPPDQKA